MLNDSTFWFFDSFACAWFLIISLLFDNRKLRRDLDRLREDINHYDEFGHFRLEDK